MSVPYRLKKKDLPNRFVYKGDSYAFHQGRDGTKLAALDPYNPRPQRFSLLSGHVLFVTGAEIIDIRQQVLDMDGDGVPDELPARPEGEAPTPEPAPVDRKLSEQIASLNEEVQKLRDSIPAPQPCELNPRVEKLEQTLAEILRRLEAVEARPVFDPNTAIIQGKIHQPEGVPAPAPEPETPSKQDNTSPSESSAPLAEGGDERRGPEWLADEMVRTGEDRATVVSRLTEEFRAEINSLNNKSLNRSATDEDNARLDLLRQRYHELALIGAGR